MICGKEEGAHVECGLPKAIAQVYNWIRVGRAETIKQGQSEKRRRPLHNCDAPLGLAAGNDSATSGTNEEVAR